MSDCLSVRPAGRLSIYEYIGHLTHPISTIVLQKVCIELPDNYYENINKNRIG